MEFSFISKSFCDHRKVLLMCKMCSLELTIYKGCGGNCAGINCRCSVGFIELILCRAAITPLICQGKVFHQNNILSFTFSGTFHIFLYYRSCTLGVSCGTRENIIKETRNTNRVGYFDLVWDRIASNCASYAGC